MKPTLTALWHGQICPADQFCIDPDQRKKLRDLDRSVADDLEALRKTLPQKTRNILDHCIETIYERQCLSEADAFIGGFSLGVKIITEAEAKY